MSTMRGLMLGYIKRVWSGQSGEARALGQPKLAAKTKQSAP